MECFNCHNIGHMAHDFNLTWVPQQAKAMSTKLEKKVAQVWTHGEGSKLDPEVS